MVYRNFRYKILIFFFIAFSMALHGQDSASCEIKLSFSVTDVSCIGGDDGAIMLKVAHVKNPEFSWSNGESTQDIMMLQAGEYNVEVRDGEFSATASVKVKEPSQALTLSISGKEDISCSGVDGGRIEVQAKGGTEPYEYSIEGIRDYTADRVFENLMAGEYQLKLKDSRGCETVASAEITETSSSLIELGNDMEILSGASIGFEVGDEFHDYLWSTGETTNSIQFSREVSSKTVEVLSVEALDENDCPVMSEEVRITILPTAESEVEDQEE